MDFFRIQSAVSGAGMLLAEGEIDTGGYIVTGRHPRTAIGASMCGSTLILMVVDGRGTSVGATHAELALLMKQAGAHNAMHLDGGASSTMVVQEHGRHTVVNRPSGGGQRAVFNALGVFDSAVPGELTGIVMETIPRHVAVGTPVTAAVLGYDALGLRFPLGDGAMVSFLLHDRDAGFWEDNVYTPLVAGHHILQAWYGFLTATYAIYAVEVAQLHAVSVSTVVGNRVPLTFSGIGVDGVALPYINVTDITVVPEYLGRMEDNAFVAAGAGTGYIRARAGRAVAYIPVSVGAASAPLPMAWTLPGFVGYLAQGTAELVPVAGHLVSRLTYRISPSEQTQAAHLTFTPALEVPVKGDTLPTHLRMQVYGDGSGHWLRGRVTDADGVSHTVNFTHINFSGWGVVTAGLPAGLTAPVTLDRVWLAVLHADDYSDHSVLFYNIQALYAPPPLPGVPEGTRFRDPLMTHGEFTGVPGGVHIARYAPVNPWPYHFALTDNTALVRLSATSNGLDTHYQWERLYRDVYNRNPCHIIIRINQNPRRFPSLVFELFHAMLRTFAAEGRTVLVNYPGADEAVLTLIDGVRYISAAHIDVFTSGSDIWWYGG